MTPQDFISAGYKRYDNTGFRKADFLLQKSIKDEFGTKYFLNVYVYNLDGREAFEAEVSFTKKFKPWRLSFWAFNSIQELENAFEEMWQNGGFDYNERQS